MLNAINALNLVTNQMNEQKVELTDKTKRNETCDWLKFEANTPNAKRQNEYGEIPSAACINEICTEQQNSRQRNSNWKQEQSIE